MTDSRLLTDDVVNHLDRLGAVILDDVGDGPPPDAFAARAREARDAVARLSIPALTELASLILGVASSIVAGATDWAPSLGGTIMSAVDDLRTLALRADQFSPEDGEHLHHRASELAAYVRVDASARSTPTSPAPSQVNAPVAAKDVVPISTLFFADAGPHIVSGGISPSATKRSDLLGAGIDALDALTSKPIAAPVSFGALMVVPVETLLYRGRAALERAAAIREQLRASGATTPPQAALDEMYDLIGLALND